MCSTQKASPIKRTQLAEDKADQKAEKDVRPFLSKLERVLTLTLTASEATRLSSEISKSHRQHAQAGPQRNDR